MSTCVLYSGFKQHPDLLEHLPLLCAEGLATLFYSLYACRMLLQTVILYVRQAFPTLLFQLCFLPLSSLPRLLTVSALASIWVKTCLFHQLSLLQLDPVNKRILFVCVCARVHACTHPCMRAVESHPQCSFLQFSFIWGVEASTSLPPTPNLK